MTKILIDEATVKLKTAAEKVVALSGERPLSLGKWFIDMSEACESLREALAEQPAQQEPVAWLHPANATCVTTDPSAYARGVPLYTTPQPAQRKPLTRDQVKAMMVENGYDQASPQERADFINGIRHGEAAHGIKENT